MGGVAGGGPVIRGVAGGGPVRRGVVGGGTLGLHSAPAREDALGWTSLEWTSAWRR